MISKASFVFRVPRDQRGAVLFVALVFLILLTLLALTATSTSILQEKMTGGMRNRQLSLSRGRKRLAWRRSLLVAIELCRFATATALHRCERFSELRVSTPAIGFADG